MTKYTLYMFIVNLVFMSAVVASEVNAQYKSVREVQISIYAKKSKIKDVFAEIETKTNFKFSYHKEDLAGLNPVNLEMANVTVAEILTEISKEARLQFRQHNNNISISPLSESSYAIGANLVVIEDVEISGKITDENGEGLPGASIVVKGSAKGTTTDLEGNYNLSIPEESVLIVSFVGYKTLEITTGTQSVIDVQMILDAEQLEEIIVVGYGTQKKSDVTGAISSVDSKTITEVPATDVSQALQGRIAGVDLQRTSTRPGADMRIRIRGNRSLGGDAANEPLIVLDGIPYQGNLNSINQGDIKSIDILKDASSTAIYGSRGSNGVIIITTKRGKPGQNNVSYNAYYGVSSPLAKYEVFNPEEYAQLVTVSPSFDLTPTELASIDAGRSVDWQDLFIENGYITNHELSMTGGSERTQYLASTNFFDEKGAMPGQSFSRYSLRLSMDHQVNDRIKLGISTMTTYAKRQGEGRNPFEGLLTLSPLVEPYLPDGTVNRRPLTGHIDDTFRINPLLQLDTDNWKDERTRLHSFTSMYGEVDIVDGLKYRINIGLDARFEERGEFSSGILSTSDANSAAVTNNKGANYTIENLLIYKKSIAEDHTIDFTGLFSAQEDVWRQSRFTTSNITFDDLEYYNFAQAGTTLSDADNNRYSEWGILSYMGRINYNYDDRLLFTLTGRRDGSSRLSEGREWFNYSAAAIGWNLYNEPFMQSSGIFSSLKLRAGYGKTSNQAIAPFSSLGRLSSRDYSFGPNGGELGYFVSELPNPNLSWEFTTTTNIGVDFGLLTNKITGSLELYQQSTKDILQERDLPIMSGVSGSFSQNVGASKNRGIELTLNALVVEPDNADDFSFEVDLNLTSWTEEITQLVDTVSRNVGNGWFRGEPIDVVYDYKKIGIWQSNEATAANEHDGSQPGDIKVADIDGDGTITAEDRMILGKLNPDLMGGLTTRFGYKGFDLSIVTFARFGGMIVSRFHQMREGGVASLEGRSNGVRVDYWRTDNPTNNYPRAGFQETRYGSTMGYFNGTFMKIRSINFGYTLPSSVIDNLGISSARVYMTANNPFKAFFSDLVDAGAIDPEPTNMGGTNTPGFGNRLNMNPDAPVMKSIIFGINVQF